MNPGVVERLSSPHPLPSYVSPKNLLESNQTYDFLAPKNYYFDDNRVFNITSYQPKIRRTFQKSATREYQEW